MRRGMDTALYSTPLISLRNTSIRNFLRYVRSAVVCAFCIVRTYVHLWVCVRVCVRFQRPYDYFLYLLFCCYTDIIDLCPHFTRAMMLPHKKLSGPMTKTDYFSGIMSKIIMVGVCVLVIRTHDMTGRSSVCTC